MKFFRNNYSSKKKLKSKTSTFSKKLKTFVEA